jgi:hypothetical protein
MTTKFVNCYRGARCVASYQIEIREPNQADEAFTSQAKARMAAASLGVEPFADFSFVVRPKFEASN